jgi:RNA polymerase sigma factor (sigma-70 family)
VGQRRHVDQQYRLLFERYWRPVRAYALRRAPDSATADDVVSEVFLTAWRRIDDIPEGSELPWLYGVARNVLSNTRRGQIRRERLVARLQSDRVAQGGVQTSLVPVVEDDGVDRLWEALGQLSEDDSEILTLATWEQLPHSEIAVALGCSVNAVAIRLHRARGKLADMLGRDPERSGHTKRTRSPDALIERRVV